MVGSIPLKWQKSEIECPLDKLFMQLRPDWFQVAKVGVTRLNSISFLDFRLIVKLNEMWGNEGNVYGS
jgi:hypothetical protein